MEPKSNFKITKISIDPLYKCPLHCKHCFVENEDITMFDDKKVSEDDWRLSIRKILELAKYIKIDEICLGGGEPLFSKGKIVAILDELQHRVSIMCTVMTSGYCINDEIIKKLKLVDEVSVSLHGHNSEIHDSFVEREGAFNTVINNIGLMIYNGINVSINSSLRRNSIDNIKHIVGLGYLLGVKHVRLLPVMYCGRAGYNLIPTIEEFDYAMEMVIHYKNIYQGEPLLILNGLYNQSNLNKKKDFNELQLEILPDLRYGVRLLGLDTKVYVVGSMLNDSIEDMIDTIDKYYNKIKLLNHDSELSGGDTPFEIIYC